MSVDLIISRLDGVKEKHRGAYVAKCPAHDDKSPSLAVTEKDDGRILLHCFGGCSTNDVLGAIGLGLDDLFEKRLGDERGFKRERRPFSAAQAFECVRLDALLIAQVAKLLEQGEKLKPATYNALVEAIAKIEKAWGETYAR